MNHKPGTVKVFDTADEVAENFALFLVQRIKESAKKGKSFSIALSGGSTPDLLFSMLGGQYAELADWSHVHFFWGDERCVSPDSNESNFGSANVRFLRKALIPESNIHRIKGENNPIQEAERYSGEIKSNLPVRNGFPVFDLIILGLGEDGHTASIFPSEPELLVSEEICEVATHPVSRQQRVSITGNVINNGECVVFLVTGMKKAEKVSQILEESPEAAEFPAFHIMPRFGELLWFLDAEAAGKLHDSI